MGAHQFVHIVREKGWYYGWMQNNRDFTLSRRHPSEGDYVILDSYWVTEQ